jgi:hypothetical protein
VAELEVGGKVDFNKSLDCYQARQGEFRVLDVPPMQYLMVDGKGDPNAAQEYAEALQAHYPVAYAIKFTSKRELGRDHVVSPLEALWWAPDMSEFISARDKSQWHWTTMLMVPDWIGPDVVDAAIAAAAAKKHLASLEKVRPRRSTSGGVFRRFTSGRTTTKPPYWQNCITSLSRTPAFG